MATTEPKQLKILVSAYACSPYHGSEPGMGWGFVSHLAQRHQVWVITEKYEFEADIARKKAEDPVLFKNLHFYFVPRTHHDLLRKIWPPSYYWFYRRWQINAYHLALELSREVDFDVCHQLNMVGFREPGYLWKLKKLPFVWGPIGGLDNTPWRLLPAMGQYGGLYHATRNIINLIHQRLLRRPRLAARRANSALIAATPFSRKRALELWKKDSRVICEVGAPSPLNEFAVRRSDEPLRLVWSGLHIPRKALNLLLEALPEACKQADIRLEIIGEGSKTGKWRQLAERLGIDAHCNWHGWVTRDHALEIMRSGHVFCITSLYDLTATVTMEALSSGLPIICLDLFGFSEVVNDECGFKIPAISREEVRHKLAEKIIFLYENEAERQRLAQGALKRAGDFSWEKKMEQLDAIYAELLEKRK